MPGREGTTICHLREGFTPRSLAWRIAIQVLEWNTYYVLDRDMFVLPELCRNVVSYLERKWKVDSVVNSVESPQNWIRYEQVQVCPNLNDIYIPLFCIGWIPYTRRLTLAPAGVVFMACGQAGNRLLECKIANSNELFPVVQVQCRVQHTP